MLRRSRGQPRRGLFFIDEAGVGIGYDGTGLPAAGMDVYFDVEIVGSVGLQGYAYGVAFHIGLGLGGRLGRVVAQHFKAVGAFADERTERHGYGQADHARAGYAYAHGVFEYVGAEQHFDAFGARAEFLGGACGTQGHRHGFGAADCGHHLALQECDELCRCSFSIGLSLPFPLQEKEALGWVLLVYRRVFTGV